MAHKNPFFFSFSAPKNHITIRTTKTTKETQKEKHKIERPIREIEGLWDEIEKKKQEIGGIEGSKKKIIIIIIGGFETYLVDMAMEGRKSKRVLENVGESEDNVGVQEFDFLGPKPKPKEDPFETGSRVFVLCFWRLG